MPPLTTNLAVTPGVNTMDTPLVVGRGITNSNLIRFRNNVPQKRGGCQHLNQMPFAGTCRCLFNWTDTSGNPYIALGTTQQLLVYSAGQFSDISPVVHTSNLAATNSGGTPNGSTPFTTTASSLIVTVADGGYTPAVGQYFIIDNAAYIDGILLQGLYQVLTVGSGTYTFLAAATGIAGSTSTNLVTYTTFNTLAVVRVLLGSYAWGTGAGQNTNLTVGVPITIGGLTIPAGMTTVTPTGTHSPYITGFGTATSNVAATAENTGNVRIRYLLALPSEAFAPVGYGTGPYGMGPYGVGSGGSSLPNLIRWSMAAWGQNLLAAYAGSTIYQWIPPPAIGNAAAALTNAPSIVNGIFVAAPQQQVFAWGAYSSALMGQDPLLLAWCDVANNTVWAASATNQAGTFRLSSGNEIVAGTWFGVVGLIWTDNDLWLVTYLGFPLVYGFNRVSVSCGLIAPRAWAVLGTRIAWMSQNDWFIFANGQVVPLPCSVRNFVFDNLDRNYLAAIHADANTWYGEIMWRFPTVGSSGVCNAWACWNVNGQWDVGWQPQTAPFTPVEVSAWVDQSITGSGVNAPIGTDYNGYIQRFETSMDYDGQVLDSSFLTGWFQIAEGTQSIFLDEILPDFVLEGGSGSVLPTVQITVFASDYLPIEAPVYPLVDWEPTENAAYPVRVYGPFPVDPTVPYIRVGSGARFVRLLIENIVSNTFWRYGRPLVVASAQERR